MLTQERLKELLYYDLDTGLFFNRVTRNKRKAWQVAGSLSNGYIQISIDGTLYKAHRLVWLYIHGQFPINLIDHINGLRDDNRLFNLREVSYVVNAQNIRPNAKKSTTKYLGVTLDRASGRYRARITVAGKNIHLGRFNTPEEAHQAYLNAKRNLHQGCTI